jgi:hypothetical protein
MSPVSAMLTLAACASAVVLVVSGATGVSAVQPVHFHVCPTSGDDAATGDVAAPFKTLGRARDAARAVPLSSTGSDTPRAVVWLHRGVHHLDSPLHLDHRDSHVHWSAARGELPRDVLLSGGVRVPTDAVTPRPGHPGQVSGHQTSLSRAGVCV